MTQRTSLACAGMLVALAACGDAPDSLRLTSASPDFGPLAGGTRITLTGAGFASHGGEPRVLIAGRQAPLAAAIDDATLEVVIPHGDQPGDAEVVVFDGTATTQATGVFHYSALPTIAAVTPPDVLYSSSSTRVTVTGSGFVDEGAGDVSVVVDGQLAMEVEVTSDTSLTFTAPPGRPLARVELQLVDGRGIATRRHAFRYTPSTRSGLLLFAPFGSSFAEFFDPVDNSNVSIPALNLNPIRFTSVVRDDYGDYWGFDRSRRFGRIDMTTQTLEDPIQTQSWFPTLARVGNQHLGIERGTLRFGSFDPVTGLFAPIGEGQIPCCGSYGLASDGTTLYLAARQSGGAGVIIASIDPITGAQGMPVPLIASPNFHVEEMRFFAGKLYASSRDGTLVTIDPATGATTVLPVNLGRFNAMEIFR